MSTQEKMDELYMKYKVDREKVFVKGNKSASIRARKYLQELKQLCGVARKEILEEIKKHESEGTSND